MGLSQDPEKRERQMANLRKGWEKHAERLQDPKPEPTPKPRAVKPALEVMDYDPPQAAKSKPAAKPKQAKVERGQQQRARKKRAPAPGPEREPAPEPGRERSGGGGFWDGFLGR